jgi:DNA-directed RNA polymerase subunit F
MEIIKETPLSMPEMKEKIEELKKRDKDLNFRAKKVEEYLNQVSKIKNYKDFKKELESLDIPRLKEKHIALIMNICPKDEDSLKTILSSENLTLKKEDMTKIIEVVIKHAP